MSIENKNRRTLLKLGASAAAIGSMAAIPKVASAQDTKKNISWDEEFDIVVVGSGVAATVASTYAAKQGASVVVLEKMGVLGGSSAISNATIAVAGSTIQKKLGIDDSWESFFNDMEKRSSGYNNPELHEVIAKRSKDVFEFMVGEGCIFEETLSKIGGQSIPRVASPRTNGAIGIMNPLRKKFDEYGGKSYVRNKVEEILFDEKDRAIGVRVKKNYRFDPSLYSDDLENETGKDYFIKANKAVICGTGGYCNDSIMRERELRKYKNLVSSQQVGATMSGYRLLEDAGAHMVNISFIQHSLPLGATLTSLGYIIDPKTGKRFFNELGDVAYGTGKGAGSARYNINIPDVVAKFIDENGGMNDKTGGNYPISIFDKKVANTYEDQLQFGRNLGAGFVVEAETIEDLAKAIGQDPAVLIETHKKYNEMIEKGVDDEFGKNFDALMSIKKDLTKDLKDESIKSLKLDTAPYYAYYVFPHLNYCCGGAYINKDGNVVKKYTENIPIKGLYAAGEATGGVHGKGRISGTSIADGTTFGMVSAENALKLEPHNS